MSITATDAGHLSIDSPSSEVSPCDLCGGRQFETICRHDRRGQPLLTGLCKRCGLVRHVLMPSDGQMADYYAHEYRRDYHGETAPSPRRVMRTWRLAEAILRRLRPWMKPDTQVFEVGAGIGCTVKAFELAGYSTTGIEPNVGFERWGRKVLGAAVQRGDLFECNTLPGQEANQRFGLVLLIHVIEHFRSPRRALEVIHKMVDKDGLLYLECPNLAAPFARPGKMFHFAHIHNFTPHTITMLAAQCGFVVERWFTSSGNPEIKVLLRRTDPLQVPIDPTSCTATRSALTRYNAVSYHLRPGYLLARGLKLARYVQHWLLASWQLRRLLARCHRQVLASAWERAAAELEQPRETANQRSDCQR